MVSKDPMQETRKRDHIDLTNKSQISAGLIDNRFYYEPLLSAHPNAQTDLSTTFLSKKLRAPFWISSMTGGVGEARHINQNLARVASDFGLGMGLGSCRALLDSDKYFEDFNLRPILGSETPFYANLGIAQLEEILDNKEENKIFDLLNRLDVDGLIVHVNPMQEWFQPEGDRFKYPPIETVKKIKELFIGSKFKIIVKEVGQGMGPLSIKALVDAGVDAIDFAAFGGTNFSKIEVLRDAFIKNKEIESLVDIGHTNIEMIEYYNSLRNSNENLEIIISGGVRNFLDAYYLRENLLAPSIVGMAKNFLNHSENYEELKTYVHSQVEGYKMAKSFLRVKTLEVK